ncbi:hypothetical protein Q5P01_025582 [Channa striata]|uniref:Uncharacterized protein n=1 Tax=Channa striata TaxID=64152 RepID=A0AA88IPU5_CHASR|nr:hypothetical protein Q5P01_025582 [Channa striata]
MQGQGKRRKRANFTVLRKPGHKKAHSTTPRSGAADTHPPPNNTGDASTAEGAEGPRRKQRRDNGIQREPVEKETIGETIAETELAQKDKENEQKMET